MGQQRAGETVRSHLKVVRLNDAELETFERKRLRRQVDASTYLRTLVEEDEG